MAYATVSDMIDRYGEAEMIRMSTPDGADMVAVNNEPIDRALDDASSLIDTYIRRRYRVPLQVAPPEIRRAACELARYDLSVGGQKNPADQVVNGRKETLAWLQLIAGGKVHLDLDEVPVGDQSYAQTSSRGPVYGSQSYDGAALAPFWDPNS